ncbi:porin [Oceanospirillum maris]|jgi:predicted porin|uniref:porin n=1 Tax=Oceanospirillum maris TaxID=64977 RepID=UPI000423F5D8|nr:porin [Oceanospirillum maris]
MKKTLIATAIAGAMSFSVAAQAAQPAPTVYGNLQIALDLEDDANAFDNGSTIGFKGEMAEENGLTVFYKAEFEHNAGAEKAAGGLTTGDQAYIGVKGSLGQVRVGSMDTLVNDFIHDAVYVPEFFGFDSAFGSGAGKEIQQVQYQGDFSAVKVGASVQMNTNTAANKDEENSVQLVVEVPVEMVSLRAAYDSANSEAAVAAVASIDNITLAAKYELGEDAAGDDLNVMGASADYNYGMGNVYLMVSDSDAKGADTQAALGATYSLTSSLYVWGEFGSGDYDKSETFGGSYLGAVLSF